MAVLTMPENHCIAIFGYDQASVEVAAALRDSDYRTLLIDDDEDNLKRAQANGLVTRALDFHDDEELATLGLGREIDTIFCLFPDDADNVFLTLSARALAPKLRIIAIAHGRSAVPNLNAAGANKVIETREICGLRIWDIITRPTVTAILDHTLFGQQNLNLAEIRIPVGGSLVGSLATETGIDDKHGLILLALVDAAGNQHFLYAPQIQEHRLQAGDILLVIGPTAAIQSLRQELE